MGFFLPSNTSSDPLPPQQVTLRQGDRLSSFAVVIEDEYGNPLDLTASRCWMTLRPITPTISAPLVERVELTIESAATGLVSYDWQASQTLGGSPGLYDVLIAVEYLNGRQVSVPSGDQAFTVNLRSWIGSDYFILGPTGALVPDGDGGFFARDPYELETGGYILLETGGYLLMETGG